MQAVLQGIQSGRVAETPAELAPVVFAAATQGDAVAQGLVDRQADELVAMVASAVRRLHLTRRDVDVVLGGGVFAGGDGGFASRITDGVHAAAPAARVARLRVPPIVGAALLACDRLRSGEAAAGRIRGALTVERFL